MVCGRGCGRVCPHDQPRGGRATGGDRLESIVEKGYNRPLSAVGAAVNARNRHYIGYTVEYRWLAISR